MIKFKGCPRCRGDLYLKQDSYGKYYNCFQCGYMKDLAGRPEMEISEAIAAGERKAA